MSASSGNSRIVPSAVTNEMFLRFLFGDQWPRALIAGFAGDPRVAEDANWTAYPATMLPSEARQRELNMYFCPSLVRGTRRVIHAFISLHVLVVDDYGTKVPAGVPEQILGVGPTYVLETSPGNYQAGWKLDPPLVDLAWTKGMLARLRDVLGAGDNLTDPVIWRRLPVGINGKHGTWPTDLGPGPAGPGGRV